MSVYSTDLMRNFHVFACSAMSRLEMTEQMSRRLWITEEHDQDTTLRSYHAKKLDRGNGAKETGGIHLLNWYNLRRCPTPPLRRSCYQARARPGAPTGPCGGRRPPWRDSAEGQPPRRDGRNRPPRFPVDDTPRNVISRQGSFPSGSTLTYPEKSHYWFHKSGKTARPLAPLTASWSKSTAFALPWQLLNVVDTRRQSY